MLKFFHVELEGHRFTADSLLSMPVWLVFVVVVVIIIIVVVVVIIVGIASV